MRKLTVKNFSVIKDAELEFGKITVLIGPQSSGKSLLCKLAYFLSKKSVDDAVESVMAADSFETYQKKLREGFLQWFPIELWASSGSFIRFESGDFLAQVERVNETNESELSFSPHFKETYLEVAKCGTGNQVFVSDFSSDRREQIRAKFNLLMSADLAGDPFVSQSLYIPGSRAFFANSSLGFNALQNPDIDPLVREFSGVIAWGEAWRPNLIVGTEALQRLDHIRRDIVSIAGGNVEGRNTNARFRRFSDGRMIPFTRLSSGTQEILPLLNVIERIATGQRDRILFPRANSLPGTQSQLILSKGNIYVEEPETSIFPSTQYELVRLFATLSSEPVLDFSWVITTHSPYILSAFSNLLEAWQVGHMDAERADLTRKVIEEKYWVNPDDFRAYAIKDGTLNSIVAEDTRLIDSNFLDEVSETTGAEFDELLRIGYVEA